MYKEKLKPELGQVWTPKNISMVMTKEALKLVRNQNDTLKVLDPSVGPGTFYSSLRETCKNKFLFTGIDIDIDPVNHCADKFGLGNSINFKCIDFILSGTSDQYDLVITNSLLCWL